MALLTAAACIGRGAAVGSLGDGGLSRRPKAPETRWKPSGPALIARYESPCNQGQISSSSLPSENRGVAGSIPALAISFRLIISSNNG
jgi:hypothetical protein